MDIARITKPDPGTLERLETELLRLVAERGPDKTTCPSEPARSIGGSAGEQWGALMPAVRRIAVSLAKQGRVVIMRKGKPADPDDFRGVYRLASARQD